MANRRTQIVNQIVNLLKTNLTGNSPYVTNIFDNAKNRQIFWDEVSDYPMLCVYSGAEVREYLPGDFQWAFLTVTIRYYVQDEDAKERLEELTDDIETVLANNNTLTLNNTDLCTDIRISSITDDEGLLNPLGVGEMILDIRYPID